jgi:hypothetical protein
MKKKKKERMKNMCYYPESEDGWNDIKQLEASDWMVEMLKKNPSYCSWGNFEDYMVGNGDGWGSSTLGT